MAVLVGLVICSRARKLRQFCAPAYYISLSIDLFVSAILLGPVAGGAGLYRLFGWSRAFILGGFFGLVTGGWVGWNVAKQISRESDGLQESFGKVPQMITAVLMLLASYLPLALFEYSLGGGSGYGEGLPMIAAKFFEHQVAPWFCYVALVIRILSHYRILSVVFWIVVVGCLFDIGRRFLEVVRLGHCRQLIKIATIAVLLMTTTIVLFFSVDVGKARPHITTACAALTSIEFGLSPSNVAKSASYPVSYLDDERETMSKYFEEWTATPIKGDPSFRVASITPDGTTEIEFLSSGTKVRSRPGRPFMCKEYGPEGLWLIDASFEKQTARFTRYICNK
jgi:hypothetical protein